MPELESLLADLLSGDDERAEQASNRLPQLGEQAIFSLSALLSDPSADTRWWAVRALAGFGGNETLKNHLLDALMAALVDETEEVRQAAALGLLHNPHPQAISPLIGALSDPDRLTAKLAASALVKIGRPAIPALLETLQTGERLARLEAVRAIAEIKDPRAITVLLKTLESDSLLTQYWAEQGLDNLGLGMVYVQPGQS